MNELRMYVEHLFEGRVLSRDVIELKEEVYGNLVARYEDYLNQGVASDDALARTKASLTSIEDVLGHATGDDVLVEGPQAGGPVDQGEIAGLDRVEGGGAASQAESQDGGAAVAETEADGYGAVAEQALEAPSASSSVDASSGAPVPPAQAAEQIEDAEGDRHRGVEGSTFMKWSIAALGVFAAFVLLGLGLRLVTGATRLEEAHTDITASVDAIEDEGAAAPSPQAAANPGHSNADDAIVVDANGAITFDGAPADELVASVVNATAADIEAYADTDLADAAAVEALVRALPLASWAQDVDVTKGVDVLSLAYRCVPDAYDGDSVDVALAYNAAALLCAMPRVNEVRVTVTESDEPNEESCYAFTRDKVQGSYGCMLSPDMMSASGWQQLKEGHLYGRKFAEHLVEAAERL